MVRLRPFSNKVDEVDATWGAKLHNVHRPTRARYPLLRSDLAEALVDIAWRLRVGTGVKSSSVGGGMSSVSF